MRHRATAIYSALAASCLTASSGIHLAAGADAPPSAAVAASKHEAFDATRASHPESVLDLQPYRQATRLDLPSFEAGPTVASLVNLNPSIGTWYVLSFVTSGGPSTRFHLESPRGDRLRLDANRPSGIVIEASERDPSDASFCELWPSGTAKPLEDARDSQQAYAPLCGGRLYLRNPVEGHRTRKEQVVELLRDNVWEGEKLTVFVRDVFYRDAYRATAALAAVTTKSFEEAANGPSAPRVSAAAMDRSLDPVDLELGITGARADGMAVGRWYPAEANPGMFVTVLRPDLVAPEVIEEQKGRVSALDPLESEALAYLVAFDLQRFDFGFEVGTDHPRVGWSEMVLPEVRDAALAGPDGIDTLEPLVRTGMLNPAEASRVAATFTGGFKRAHGAFRTSELALVDHGSHYGFMQNGVVLSKLQPGLATVLVFDDGRVDLRTWSAADAAELPRIRHARQNGVAILEPEKRSRRVVPGARVRQWGAGNWSGSADKKLRTVRGGLCLQEKEGRQFLLYGYFSSATPSAMARVFQACDCRYAMLLDMNALEHTYMAAYHREASGLVTQHLIDGMGAVDGSRGGEPLPRFVSVADNRDFFYLLRREPR